MSLLLKLFLFLSLLWSNVMSLFLSVPLCGLINDLGDFVLTSLWRDPSSCCRNLNHFFFLWATFVCTEGKKKYCGQTSVCLYLLKNFAAFLLYEIKEVWSLGLLQHRRHHKNLQSLKSQEGLTTSWYSCQPTRKAIKCINIIFFKLAPIGALLFITILLLNIYTKTNINSHPLTSFDPRSLGTVSRWLIRYAMTPHHKILFESEI